AFTTAKAPRHRLTIMTPMSGGFDWLAVGDVAEERVAASGPGILGGGAARLTAHAAALRARTALVAKVGADEAGRRVRDALERLKVDLRWLRETPGLHTTIWHQPDGETEERRGGAAGGGRPSPVRVGGQPRGAAITCRPGASPRLPGGAGRQRVAPRGRPRPLVPGRGERGCAARSLRRPRGVLGCASAALGAQESRRRFYPLRPIGSAPRCAPPAARHPAMDVEEQGGAVATVTSQWRRWRSPATPGWCRPPVPLLLRGDILAPLAGHRRRVRGALALRCRTALADASRVERVLRGGAGRARRAG